MQPVTVDDVESTDTIGYGLTDTHLHASILSLVAATASVAGIYFLGKRMFGRAALGVVAAATMALTPLLWRQWQIAPASLYPLPFVVVWLWAAERLCGAQRSWSAAVAGGVLGMGVYSSRAAQIMMPLYGVLTIAMLAPARLLSPRRLAVFAAAFVVAATPFVVSVMDRPEDFRRAITAFHLYDASRFNILQGIHEMVSWVGLTARSEVYYDYFNPAFLFLTGPVLPLPLLVLLPFGLYQIAVHEPYPFARLCLAGFVAAPFAAALTAERPTPGRILLITPFAALVTAYGIQYLLSLRKQPISSCAG